MRFAWLLLSLVAASCTVESCKDGVCEERACTAHDGSGGLKSTTGRLLSCPQCRLEHPSNAELKRWLAETEEWKQYRNLEMQWIQGHNPELSVLDDSGKEVERIDLNGKRGLDMHRLLKSKGFQEKGSYYD